MTLKEKLRDLITRNEIEKAIQLMQDWASANGEESLNNTLILLQSQYFRLIKDENAGILFRDESSRTHARITNALLNLLSRHDFDKGNAPVTSSPPPPSGEQVVGNSVADEAKVILFLASNPDDTAKLELNTEYVRISTNIQDFHKKYRLKAEMALTTSDLQNVLLTHRPNIIHFSGHGEKGTERGALGGIVLKDSKGKSKLVSGRALADLFRILAPLMNIEMVVLNACYSEEQATAIAPYVNHVIGMQESIEDDAAIEFSTGFYRSLANLGDPKIAFELAKNQVMIHDLKDEDVPQMKSKNPG